MNYSFLLNPIATSIVFKKMYKQNDEKLHKPIILLWFFIAYLNIIFLTTFVLGFLFVYERNLLEIEFYFKRILVFLILAPIIVSLSYLFYLIFAFCYLKKHIENFIKVNSDSEICNLLIKIIKNNQIIKYNRLDLLINVILFIVYFLIILLNIFLAKVIFEKFYYYNIQLLILSLIICLKWYITNISQQKLLNKRHNFKIQDQSRQNKIVIIWFTFILFVSVFTKIILLSLQVLNPSSETIKHANLIYMCIVPGIILFGIVFKWFLSSICFSKTTMNKKEKKKNNFFN
ncbi:hypothetical protein [[Mycoplasma] anseris]|uniref:Uncharacterized protein n=1 Tax=[Mycoplasma] anseris TaxID=92400 RepID=A0A2Z4ND75_9BACT|nr:hypothetical protein [[Mycoplasma] anseris]AWX69467.1 hypothetical protein DP065_01720 [[Mycoplasma] anseris]